MSLTTRTILALGFSTFFVVGLGVTVSAQSSCQSFSGTTSYAPASQDQPPGYEYFSANTTTVNAGQSVVLTYQAEVEYDACLEISDNVDSWTDWPSANSLEYYCANQVGRSGCSNWGIDEFTYSGSVTTPALYQTTQFCLDGEGDPPCTTITVNPVACTSGANVCGQTNSGYLQSGGSCSASTPANPSYYGTSCSATSGANACGQTNTNYGSYNCSDACTASTPSAPANPGYYGQSCSSSANSCGQTNSGTLNCSDVCSASAPSNGTCPPSTPSFAYLYDDANGSYVGTTGSAYHSSNYRIYFEASSPDGSNIAVYYELYNAQTASVYAQGWATPTWNGSGSWAEYVDSFANFAPGTYYVQAYSYDADGESSGWSGWQTITLSTPAVTTSCSVSPTTTSIGSPVTWAATASGGSGTGYTYTWTGTSLTGQYGSSVQATYSSGGTYPGDVTVTDSVGDSSGEVACTAGGGGQGAGGASIYVVPAPTVSLSATPSTINTGSSATLTWSSTNATSCTAVGGFSTGGATNNGSGVSTGSLTSSQSYQIYCTGASGTTYSNIASVTVLQPSVDITATPPLVDSGQGATIAWSASNVTACTVTGTDGYNSGSVNGPIATTTHQTGALTNPVTYTISCPTQNISQSAGVDISPSINEF